MKILFTGTSSFTGFYFINQLAQDKQFEIHAILSKKIIEYDGLRKERISLINSNVKIHQNIQFGDEDFLNILNSEKHGFDILCCHGAFVENYNSAEFDIIKALSSNTKNISLVLKYFKDNGGKIVINTGSIFEPDEGECDENRNAFNLYGLSKKFTNDLIRYHCQINNLSFGKFVIPNPFGIYEEPRFTKYLFKCWNQNETPLVQTPKYIRDNVPVDLLARSYNDFLLEIHKNNLGGWVSQDHRINPSGYVESQGVFTKRIVENIKINFGLNFNVNFFDQIIFNQPFSRYNKTNLFELYPDWDETKFWRKYIGEYINKY